MDRPGLKDAPKSQSLKPCCTFVPPPLHQRQFRGSLFALSIDVRSKVDYVDKPRGFLAAKAERGHWEFTAAGKPGCLRWRHAEEILGDVGQPKNGGFVLRQKEKFGVHN